MMWMCEGFEGRMESMMVELWILLGSCSEGMKIPWSVRGLEVVIAIFLMLPGEMLVDFSVYTLIGPFCHLLFLLFLRCRTLVACSCIA